MRLRRVTDYIRDHPTDELSLRMIADIAGVEPQHFARLFYTAAGMLPDRFILQHRIARAATLLANVNLSNAETGLAVATLKTPGTQQAIGGVAIDALVKNIPLREAFFYAETFRQNSQANEPNDPWRLLELVFSLHLWPETEEDLLSPLNKLSPENIAVLRSIFLESQDAEIRSRLGDILWLFSGDRRAMGIAIEAYLESGLRLEDPAHWGHSIRRYQRAAELTLDLKKKTSLRRSVGDFVLDRVRFYEGKDAYYFTERALAILFMLRTGDPTELYRHAFVAAERARANGDGGRARACYTAAEKISHSAKNVMGILSARIAIAESWVEEAERLDSAGDFLTVRYVWKRAILAYRRIGNETKAAELRIRLKNAMRIGRRQMRSLSTKTVRQKNSP